MYASMLIHFSPVQHFATLWTVACQAPLRMGFSRQEYLSGLAYPPLGNHPNLEMEPVSPSLDINNIFYLERKKTRKRLSVCKPYTYG